MSLFYTTFVWVSTREMTKYKPSSKNMFISNSNGNIYISWFFIDTSSGHISLHSSWASWSETSPKNIHTVPQLRWHTVFPIKYNVFTRLTAALEYDYMNLERLFTAEDNLSYSFLLTQVNLVTLRRSSTRMACCGWHHGHRPRMGTWVFNSERPMLRVCCSPTETWRKSMCSFTSSTAQPWPSISTSAPVQRAFSWRSRDSWTTENGTRCSFIGIWKSSPCKWMKKKSAWPWISPPWGTWMWMGTCTLAATPKHRMGLWAA